LALVLGYLASSPDPFTFVDVGQLFVFFRVTPVFQVASRHVDCFLEFGIQRVFSCLESRIFGFCLPPSALESHS